MFLQARKGALCYEQIGLLRSPEMTVSIFVVRTADASPALFPRNGISLNSRTGCEGVGGCTNNTPMLIAKRAPVFSVVFISRFQSIFQGRMARVISVAAEYAATNLRSATASYVSWASLCLPPANCEYLIVIRPSRHHRGWLAGEPGARDCEGCCWQANQRLAALVLIRMLMVIIMNQRRYFIHPTGSRSSVKAKDALLKALATKLNVPAAAQYIMTLPMFAGGTSYLCRP